jgi:hypothetical protein
VEEAGASAGASERAPLERVKAMCLKGNKQMMSDDVIISLSESVEAWHEMWLAVADDERPLNLEVFHRPQRMFQDLMLTALICFAHSQVWHKFAMLLLF